MSLAIRMEAEAAFPTKSVRGPDYTAWAKRIVFRHERGDTSLIHVQIRFAYEALNLELPNK